MHDIDDTDVGGRAISAEVRNQLAAKGLITGWDNAKRPVRSGYGPSDVWKYCVNDIDWQRVRLSMKGVDTYRKLEICEAWWDRNSRAAEQLELVFRQEHLLIIEIQVGNYLGALRRGGQLNDDNQIRKAR